MAKRTVRRPTEEQALSNVEREQKQRLRAAARQVAQQVREGKVVDREILELARKFFQEG